jgi:hypothetical protein
MNRSGPMRSVRALKEEEKEKEEEKRRMKRTG